MIFPLDLRLLTQPHIHRSTLPDTQDKGFHLLEQGCHHPHGSGMTFDDLIKRLAEKVTAHSCSNPLIQWNPPTGQEQSPHSVSKSRVTILMSHFICDQDLVNDELRFAQELSTQATQQRSDIETIDFQHVREACRQGETRKLLSVHRRIFGSLEELEHGLEQASQADDGHT